MAKAVHAPGQGDRDRGQVGRPVGRVEPGAAPRAAELPRRQHAEGQDRVGDQARQRQDQSSYEIVVYEGYGPHGVAMIVETATDNPTRTVANVRMHFKDQRRQHGHDRIGRLPVPAAWACSGFSRRGSSSTRSSSTSSTTGSRRWARARATRARSRSSSAARSPTSGSCRRRSRRAAWRRISAESEYIPPTHVELPEEQATEVLELVDALEQDEDVQHVFHNLA